MKRGTKIGWALVAVSIIISVWVLAGGVGRADSYKDDSENVLDVTGNTVNGIITFKQNPIVLPNSVTNIAPGAFANNQNIKIVEANNVTSIGDHAFDSCESLETIELSNVEKIGNSAFDGCSKLSSITVTNSSLLTIGSNAFKDCVNMVSVTIPASTTSIETNAFSGCRSLVSIDVNGDHYATDGIALYTAGYEKLLIVPPAAGSGTSRYDIMSGCKTVGADAFADCTNIQHLYVPLSVTKWEMQNGWAPRYIYVENDNLDSDIYKQLYSNFDGNKRTRIVSYDYNPEDPDPVDPNPPGPGTGYSITNIVPNADGTVTIFFSAPGASSGTAGGIALDNGVNCSVAPNGTGCTVTLTKALVDSLRPASGTKSIPVSLTYTNTSTGQQYPASSAFILSASGSVDPGPVVTTYTIMPEYREMYNTDGSFVMETNAPYSAIQSVTLSNNGNQDLSGYYTIENLGTGSRITISSNYIRGLTPGGQYTFKVNFNDGKAAVYSKLKIKTTSSGGSTSGGTTGGSTYRPSTSGGTYTSGTGTVSNLYGNGTGTTYGGGYTTTASSATGTSHLKDTTPSTADGWDARLAFAIAVLLAGVVVLMLSRRNAAKLETIRRDREGQEH